MSSSELLTERLGLIRRWYRGMVDARTGMLEYLYIPDTDTFAREHSPIRDIASAWDAALVDAFLGGAELRETIERTVAHFAGYLVGRDDALILDPSRLEEPSSIAHSAFMILAMLHAPASRWTNEIAALADGILAQQRPDGSYAVYFDELPDSGEELYAGEAMLALVAAHAALREPRWLESAERGWRYYDVEYFQRGRVDDDILVFFANWQSQACRLLFEHARSPALAHEIAGFLYRLHDRVIAEGLFRAVARRPSEQDSVTVACALEGLADAHAVARAERDPRVDTYRQSICAGLDYLLTMQCTAAGAGRARGGFGFTSIDRRQRIDVTGHAASAFMKIIENDVAC